MTIFFLIKIGFFISLGVFLYAIVACVDAVLADRDRDRAVTDAEFEAADRARAFNATMKKQVPL